MEQKLTLFELNHHIKDALYTAFPGAVWVIAEISELKENRNGHCYLELIEKQGQEIVARARANIWSYTYRILKPYFETTTGQPLGCDIKVLVKATVEFHPQYGLSLNIKDIDPAYTMGDMLLHRKEIIEQLQKEGVFNMNKELTLPLVPQNIAVISSATAAGYQDFINQLEINSNGFVFHTRLFEAYMQGTAAASSIIEALEQIYKFSDSFDAVAIIRGGGATADLSSFDNYNLAYHITQFPLPVITGIGHEKDDTVIDLVAHTRLKTPTAVAEFFITGAESFYDQLLTLEQSIVQKSRETLEERQEQLEHFADELQRWVSGYVGTKSRHLQKTTNLLQQRVSSFTYNKKHKLTTLVHIMQSGLSVRKLKQSNLLATKQSALTRVARELLVKKKATGDNLSGQLKGSVRRVLTKEQERINRNSNTVRLLNPENILRRGYTLTMKNGRIIKSAHLADKNEEIETVFSDGKIKSKII